LQPVTAFVSAFPLFRIQTLSRVNWDFLRALAAILTEFAQVTHSLVCHDEHPVRAPEL